tara:strand:- start:6903 stop:7253 length:351 start_codon:yes stop_codon:yes gene_type:complete
MDNYSICNKTNITDENYKKTIKSNLKYAIELYNTVVSDNKNNYIFDCEKWLEEYEIVEHLYFLNFYEQSNKYLQNLIDGIKIKNNYWYSSDELCKIKKERYLKCHKNFVKYCDYPY